MKQATLEQVKSHLSEYLDDCVENGPLVITRRGKKIGVLLTPVDDDDLERLLLARNPRFQEMLARANKSIDEGKGLTHEEFWKEVEERAKQREEKIREKKLPVGRTPKKKAR